MAHATFPASRTTMTESAVDVPAGRSDTRLYTVVEEGGGVKRLHFARTMPGPPLLTTVEKDGAEVYRTTMLERTPRVPTP